MKEERKTKKNKKVQDVSSLALKVESFVEKPDKETAIEFVDSGKYYCNTGVIVAKASALLAEVKKYEPDVFYAIKNAEISSQIPTIPYLDYVNAPNVSIDSAILENSKKVVMLPIESEWADIGSWESVYDVSEKDDYGNCKIGNVVDIDSENSLIYSTSKLITTII